MGDGARRKLFGGRSSLWVGVSARVPLRVVSNDRVRDGETPESSNSGEQSAAEGLGRQFLLESPEGRGSGGGPPGGMPLASRRSTREQTPSLSLLSPSKLLPPPG